MSQRTTETNDNHPVPDIHALIFVNVRVSVRLFSLQQVRTDEPQTRLNIGGLSSKILIVFTRQVRNALLDNDHQIIMEIQSTGIENDL